MPLIDCPDYKLQVSTLAIACPGYGRPNTGSTIQRVSVGFSTNLRNCPDRDKGRKEITCNICGGSGRQECSSCNGLGEEYIDVGRN